MKYRVIGQKKLVKTAAVVENSMDAAVMFFEKRYRVDKACW